MTVIGARRRPIAVLEPEVVDRIAAGEVIDHPGAVVRELIDNALDAGAGLIQVELRAGGLDLIRAADDGCGIDPDDLELAFERHSTSKLRAIEDLGELSSYGFRGEALPSIAAAAEVEIVSSIGGAATARRALLRGGEVVESGAAARERGTTVYVRDLFGRLPVRLRFVRDPRAEVAAVARRVKWCAVAHPGVRFELIVDGRLLFRSTGGGRPDLALIEAQGEALRHRLRDLPAIRIGPYGVSGLLTVGGLTRPSRQHLALFVNGRRVRLESVESAIESGYSGLLPAGRHPVGAVFIDAPPGTIDLNVHPSKEKVRLQDEALLAAGLQEQVRALIAASPTEPQDLQSFELERPRPTPRAVAEHSGLWEPADSFPSVPRYLAQLHNALLLCEGRQGLLLVDQHRAHERALFERLREAGRPEAAQALLEPAIIDVASAQVPLIEQRLAELTALGFEYERFGDRAYRLRSAPVLPEPGELLNFAAEALALAGEQDEFWRDRLLATVACKSAVKKGRPLPPLQAAALIDDVFHCTEPTTCPHGSPVVLQLSRPFLKRQFRW
jgi:DNA mismatch repair protein MutL